MNQDVCINTSNISALKTTNRSEVEQNIVNQAAVDYRYFDIGENWTKTIQPIFESKMIQTKLFQDFKKYANMKEAYLNLKYKEQGSTETVSFTYNRTNKPIDFDSCTWRCSRKGRPPIFDQYVCHSACHWIVNSLLLTARIAYPSEPWIIVTSDEHSTVWDQKQTFFDMNFSALKAPPAKCAEFTVLNPESIFLEKGGLLKLVKFK